jgi:hypothetical protein
MKDELIALLVKKAGLKQDQAIVVVDVVVGFLKKKFPAFAPELDLALNANIDLAAAENMIEGLIDSAKKSKKK